MDLIFLTELIIDIVDWIDLPIEEKVVLEILHLCWSEWPCEVEADISLLLDVLVFGVVFRLTEALHEGFEPSPFPVSSRHYFIANSAGKTLG